MKLSIIIPCNQDTLQNQDLTAMFNSLNNQVHVDWEEVEVILVHPYAQYKFDMKEYPELKPYFKAYYTKKTTYAGIKQFGLEIAQGDYVLFLMPNNILYCMTSLIDTMQKLTENPIQDFFLFNVGDCLSLNEETKTINLNNSITNLEGKIFKREYLLNNNIAFIEEVSSGEDIYFTQKLLNLNPQHFIDPTILVLQIYPIFSSIPMEKQYLNNVEVLSQVNTENVINVTNNALDKIVEMLLQIYESLYSYDNLEYQNLIKGRLKSFVLNLQALVNINAIFTKCMEVSQNYTKNEILALNNDKTFYDFIVSIFIDEEEEPQTNNTEEVNEE